MYRNISTKVLAKKYRTLGINGVNRDLDKIKEEYYQEPIILHTAQGLVYSSHTYNNLLQDFNIQRSMSRAGTPTNNPVN